MGRSAASTYVLLSKTRAVPLKTELIATSFAAKAAVLTHAILLSFVATLRLLNRLSKLTQVQP